MTRQLEQDDCGADCEDRPAEVTPIGPTPEVVLLSQPFHPAGGPGHQSLDCNLGQTMNVRQCQPAWPCFLCCCGVEICFMKQSMGLAAHVPFIYLSWALPRYLPRLARLLPNFSGESPGQKNAER